MQPKWVWAFGILTTALAYFRIYFGVEITDEAYYVAVAYLSSIGGTPYVNDVYFQQNASLVYEPVVYLYHFFFGGTGIILFVRHLYFGLALSVAVSWTLVLRRFVRTDFAFLISLLPVTFVLSAVPSLGYNAVGSLGFGLGAALALNGALGGRTLLPAGFVFSLALFGYPTFAPAVVLLYLAMLFWFWKERGEYRLDVLLSGVLGAALVVTYFALLVWRVGFENLEFSYEVAVVFGALGSAWDKVRYTIDFSRESGAPWWTWALAAAASIGLKVWRREWWPVAVFGYGVACLTLALYGNPPPSHLFLTFAALLGIPLFVTRERSRFWVFATGIYAITMIQAAVVAWTSGNSIYNASLASQYALMMVLMMAARNSSRAITFATLVFVNLCLLFWTYNYMYRDDSLWSLDAVMESGPWAGMVTSAERKALLEEIEADILRAAEKGRSILFYDSFPGGYFYTDLYPATRSVFIHPMPYGTPMRETYYKYYLNPANRPDVFFQFESFPYSRTTGYAYRNSWSMSPDDKFYDQLPRSGEYELLWQRPHYKVWRKKGL
ncbi:MAG TPA: hypothetical protein PKC28_10330 [Bdellovibrionales bacterium]|nr:hypothetical protein [Bdellovibrionales bacterium]